ncbi:hypothetical protein [Longispora albida]|uniref:hypothetical protein n=1 Tax=Longispora albida TaxID=203523 RepID=UPI00058D3223|nr:hypothetical protein [Longispora albida]
MGVSDSYQQWADVHVFHHPHAPAVEPSDPIAVQLAAWNRRMADTPNGELLADNVLFDTLRQRRSVSLLHVTHTLDQIIDRGVLYPSGGCLVGSVYCTPLRRVGGTYSMHNLGAYVLHRETALAAGNGHTHGTPTPLIIDIDLPPGTSRSTIGIDYLRLGEIHLQIYQDLEYLLARGERHRLRDTIIGRVRDGMPFLAACLTRTLRGTRTDPASFLDWLADAVDHLPILGYLYFEVLAEYLMLHSNAPRARDLRERREFDNWLYKDLLFAAFPGMAGRFDLARFQPRAAELAARLPGLDPTIELGHLAAYVADRVALLVCARLLTSTARDLNWRRLRWEFDDLRPHAAPLLGHLIHRELRAFGRYPDFYFYFDQYKALQAWNYWNHLDIVLPFNATMPKGEIGVNPAYPDLRHTIRQAVVTGDGSLEAVKDLDVTIAPRLIDLRHTLMRARPAAQPSGHRRQEAA